MYNKKVNKNGLLKFMDNLGFDFVKKEVFRNNENQITFDVFYFTNDKFDNNSYSDNMKLLGFVDRNDPSYINIFPRNLSSKEKIVSFIDEYNSMQRKGKKDDLVITYTIKPNIYGGMICRLLKIKYVVNLH